MFASLIQSNQELEKELLASTSSCFCLSLSALINSQPFSPKFQLIRSSNVVLLLLLLIILLTSYFIPKKMLTAVDLIIRTYRLLPFFALPLNIICIIISRKYVSKRYAYMAPINCLVFVINILLAFLIWFLVPVSLLLFL